MRKISTARSSRRAPPLKDSDYDHEIGLVDHAPEAAKATVLSPEPTEQTEEADHALATCQTAESDKTLSRYTTAVSNTPEPTPQSPSRSQAGPSSPRKDVSEARSNTAVSRRASGSGISAKSKKSKGSLRQSHLQKSSRDRVDVPTVEVERKHPLLFQTIGRMTCVF